MIYLDSSALVKLLKSEPETPALRAFLDASSATEIGTSSLAETEVRRAALKDGLSACVSSVPRSGEDGEGPRRSR